ncbi:GDSL-type esterase/lipase family protein [Nocardia donostiensis]|uniref:GDSL-type esterase/lipase family protein n=1 Tax=Nocardia donostiensis TaxID=1538463 RepID=UPI0020CA9206|nr:GDSL-type esterase/lipase family protein [Nocardia donostiensis]
MWVIRLPEGSDARVVFSFGVNDTTIENGRPRIEPGTSAVNLTEMLATAAELGWPALVVAPPPTADPAHNARTVELDESFAAICAATDTVYVRTHQTLAADPTWMREVRNGDGAHPGVGGYTAFAELLQSTWLAWLQSTDRTFS